ncbi:dTDP-glucose 4,6-dehydratase [bacterium SCSIO 12741]|nr:dTDP-glucose 4,6-dehydratase [bacterium SCSIO 12741]
MSFSKTILITGGAGFIGSHVVRLFVNQYPDTQILNLDKLTYAGNLENLRDIENAPNYKFVKGDICDSEGLDALFTEYNIEGVIHLAAESHVDRSIENPLAFVQTNVIGTVTLLNAAKKAWAGDYENRIFYHISTDEVYGSLGETGLFEETTSYDPKSPYSASKASSDHFVRAYANTYKMRVKISNCSNNYGPFQFPEKLIPLCINNIVNEKPLPIYGKGENIRDWLYVVDHAEAIEQVYRNGKDGETYNIGGHNEWTNIDLVRLLCDVTDELTGKEVGTSQKLITYVTDRAGHDMRYAIDASKIERELGWKPSLTFEVGLRHTVEWYLNNSEWLQRVVDGDYQNYYANMYQER